MSNIIFQLLEEKGVPTHFVEQISDRETVVKAVKILPLEVIMRNVSAGSFAKRYGVEEGIQLTDLPLSFHIKTMTWEIRSCVNPMRWHLSL